MFLLALAVLTASPELTVSRFNSWPPCPTPATLGWRKGLDGTMHDLTVQKLSTEDELKELECEWNHLLGLRPRWLPFETPEWHAAWWSHLPEHKPWVTDELSSFAIRSRTGELVGVAPMMSTKRPGLGPLAVTALDFIGPDPNLTELRGVVSHPELETEVHHALRQHLHEVSGWHWIHWRGLRVGSATEKVLSALPGVQAQVELRNYVIHLPATWEELRASRPRNLKESLRKCYNSLKRDGHAFTFEVATTREAVSSALGRFFALHNARSQLSDTTSHIDVFAAESSRAFVIDVCRRLIARGSTRVFELRIGGDVVASRVGFVQGDLLYLYYSGYDPKWADYSVMTTTVAEAMKYAISQGLKQVNLSFGTDVSKTRWDPELVVYKDLVEVAPALTRRYAYPAYQEARRVLDEKGLRKLLGHVLSRRA